MMLFYILAGIVFGLIGSMGLGGGVILIPILTLLFSLPQHAAQAANLITYLPMAAFALFLHGKNGQLRLKRILFMLPFGLLGGALGAYLAAITEADFLRKIFGGFLIFTALNQFLHSRRNRKA
ncbi:MAG: sulfite exporter TauE/SafE family protein [Christensenellaceae bacterium]|nr:sulfite exporter TauE/SafE family protein [Christensenellaceae bacterium]